jgi:aconitase A
MNSFHASTAIFNVVMKMKIIIRKLLNNELQNARRHQKNQESDEDDTTEHERVTNQDATKCTAGLRLHFKQ